MSFNTMYAGKVVCFDVLAFPVIYFKIEADTIRIVSKQPADVTLKGSPLHFLQILFFGYQIGLLDIQGDVTLAQDFFESYQKKSLDLPFLNAFFQMMSRRREDLHHFLHDETQHLVTTQNAENFYKQVDALRNQAERLEARINLLAGRMKT